MTTENHNPAGGRRKFRFAANLSFLFTEHPFLERFGRAADAGFTGVEFLFPYDHDPGDIRALLTRHGLDPALHNMPPGDWGAGDRGLAALPARRREFAESLTVARRYADALGVRRLHVMAGVTGSLDRGQCEATFIDNMRRASDAFGDTDVKLLIEPLNTRDMPGYFVSRQDEALRLIERIDRPNVSVQLDLYHAQIMEGDLTRLIERMAGRFDHVQIASVPDRNEPDGGEIAWGHIFGVLESVGYDGWVGCEYHPRSGTLEGLSWLDACRFPPAVARAGGAE